MEKRIILIGEKMESRFSRVLQGQAQSRLFMSQGMLDRLERMTKRVVGRQIDQRVLAELAKFKLEFPHDDITWGTVTITPKTIASILLSSADVKVLSFVKNIDQTTIGQGVYGSVLSLGIEDMSAEVADDWADLIVNARIQYKDDKVTPDSVVTKVMGAYTHAKIYYDGTMVYESELAGARYLTFYTKSTTITS